MVEARYSIALCRGCGQRQYTLNVGEVLSWFLAERDSRNMCNTTIKNTDTNQLLQSEQNSPLRDLEQETVLKSFLSN